jgi:glycosyltransferase involved in cell wall biosynthesis
MQSERQTDAIEVSVVIPCLNEEDTLARCIEKARRALREHNIAGEIVVADNGSTDSSGAIGERQGARVIMVKQPGYGSALMGGIAAASGRFVIIGDADDSYDFLEIPKIVEKLREGFDLRMQASRRGWLHSTRRDAIFASLGWQSIFFFSRPEMVPCPDQRRLLWSARFYQDHVRTARSALHRNGVRHLR